MSALKVLDKLIQKVLFVDRWKARPGNLGIPGEAISKLSKEDREELQKLTSEEISDTRINDDSLCQAAYWCDDYYTDREQTKRLKEGKLDFDKKVLKIS